MYNVPQTQCVLSLAQGDGDSAAKSKVRAKKPNSKYNEEISSESEAEG